MISAARVLALTARVTLLPRAYADKERTEAGSLLKTSWKQRGHYAAITHEHAFRVPLAVSSNRAVIVG